MFAASMKFDLGEDVDALREMVHRWAQERVKPMAAEIDRTNTFPADLWEEMGELGLLGITVPQEDGGAGMGYLAHVVAVEEVARASASVSLSYGAHSNLCVNQINLNGSAEQKAKYLPDLISGKSVGALAMSEAGAGSDVVGMKLRAEKRNDRFILNGNKFWITNGGEANTLVVYAKTDPDAGSKGHHRLSDREIGRCRVSRPVAAFRQAGHARLEHRRAWSLRMSRCPTTMSWARRARRAGA